MKIIDYQPKFANQIVECFCLSIQAIPDSIYTKAERLAWLNHAGENMDYWYTRLAATQPYLALANEQVIGFLELNEEGYIDCLYVHPQHQRQKVAYKLYQHIEAIAQRKKMIYLFTEASHLARPFFEQQGFVVLEQLTHLRDGQVLINFAMKKML